MAQSIRDDDGVSNTSRNVSLTELVDQAIARNPQRRLLLKSGLGAALLPFLGGLAACGGGSDTVTTPPPATPREAVLGFNPVAVSTGDVVIVPEGYTAEILNRCSPTARTLPAMPARPGARPNCRWETTTTA